MSWDGLTLPCVLEETRGKGCCLTRRRIWCDEVVCFTRSLRIRVVCVVYAGGDIVWKEETFLLVGDVYWGV